MYNNIAIVISSTTAVNCSYGQCKAQPNSRACKFLTPRGDAGINSKSPEMLQRNVMLCDEVVLDAAPYLNSVAETTLCNKWAKG